MGVSVCVQPLEEAADEAQGAAAAAADNPFAALFQQGGGGGGAAGGDGVQQPAGAPNEAPLPNPWAAGGDGGGGGGGGAGLGGLAGMGGMGGMDPAAMQQVCVCVLILSSRKGVRTEARQQCVRIVAQH